jgi:hypothetical protein
MEIKRQIQKLVEIGFTKENLSKQSPKQINTLYESMVNAHGFVGYGKMDKPIGRMFSGGKKTEAKEAITQTKDVTTTTNIPLSDIQNKGTVIPKSNDPNKPSTAKVENGVLKISTAEGEMTEGKKKRKKKVEKNPWAICTSSLGLEGKKKDDYTKGEDKKFERCVLDVKKSLKEGKNPYEVILERKMREIIEENLRPTMTKKDLIKSILESKTKEKTKEKEKTTTPTRKNPFQPAPNTDPKPKGSGTKEKEKTKEKERTTTNPRKNPFQPAPNTDPRPKGKLPDYLSFGKMNIKLKGE